MRIIKSTLLGLVGGPNQIITANHSVFYRVSLNLQKAYVTAFRYCSDFRSHATLTFIAIEGFKITPKFLMTLTFTEKSSSLRIFKVGLCNLPYSELIMRRLQEVRLSKQMGGGGSPSLTSEKTTVPESMLCGRNRFSNIILSLDHDFRPPEMAATFCC